MARNRERVAEGIYKETGPRGSREREGREVASTWVGCAPRLWRHRAALPRLAPPLGVQVG